MEDSLGQGLIPTDLPSNLEGVQAKKATRLTTKKEALGTIAATELYENAPFYATHPNLSEAASDCGLPEISLFIQCLSESGLKAFDDTKDRFEAVKGEAIAGCRDRKWSVMMHMLALSTVIGRPIFSLYPECNTNTHPLCHKRIVSCD
ncbi:hypothetical protein OS493_011478 [Desmophyllum pertusum]|uniref:Uncharacterized protein n=1 Tax=Desmophyllum pertusum TaxID=174260 RepID=A0A9W9YQF8_9CNID|nr:hypothetical protein OS493_011478 [Desmophyllum pertusum]